jgi:hypothetical protein
MRKSEPACRSQQPTPCSCDRCWQRLKGVMRRTYTHMNQMGQSDRPMGTNGCIRRRRRTDEGPLQQREDKRTIGGIVVILT